jgi:hypothetical protein
MGNIWNHPVTTLLGALGAAGVYFGSQAGPGWQLLAVVIPLVIGMIAKDPNAPTK